MNGRRGLSSLRRVVAEELFPPHVNHRLIVVQILIGLLPHGMLPRVRTMLYRLAGVQIGRGSAIMGTLRLWGSGQLRIGDNSTINPPCAISLDADVTIGDGVLIGHDTVFATGSHDIGPPESRGGALVPLSIVVEDGVWVGAGVLVLPGVTLGAGCVVAGGALVKDDVPADVVVAGVPAKVIREL